ncbi:MAG: uL15 family ribosomal protein [Candidatus Hodarchaeales archaeon]
MTIRKNKKIRKQRGRRTYGYGRISGGHRKSGSRGGKGNAGIKNHHRITRIADVIKSQKGFIVQRTKNLVSSINIGDINRQLESLLQNGSAKKEGKVIKLNLSELGINKVLGKGTVSHPLELVVENITEKAKEKIESAGGQVVLTSENI